MAQGCFRGCSGPQGAVHIGLQTPLALGLYPHTICRLQKCFHTDFQLLIFQIEDYIVQGHFLGCSGPLGAVQDPQRLSLGGLRPPQPYTHTTCRASICLNTNFQLLISIFDDFMAKWQFRGCAGPLGAVFGGVPGINPWQTLLHVLIHTLRSANQS